MPAGVFYVIWSGRLVVFVGLAYGLEAMTRCDFSRKPMAIRRRQDCGFGALAAALSDALVLSQHPCSFDVLVAPAWSAPPAFALQGTAVAEGLQGDADVAVSAPGWPVVVGCTSTLAWVATL